MSRTFLTFSWLRQPLEALGVIPVAQVQLSHLTQDGSHASCVHVCIEATTPSLYGLCHCLTIMVLTFLFVSATWNFPSRKKAWASLVAQWLRICLSMQGTRVRALVWEDPTCHGATRPVSHNY